MKPEELLSILSVAERLKCATRHCDTSTGRRESVAEHSWRAALMAMLMAPEFPQADMDRVIRMCLIHDLGEAFTGDIPTFDKTKTQEEQEDTLLAQWVDSFPEPTRGEFRELLAEMAALQTTEARIYKAIDRMEAVIQHNEADIRSWIPLEYELQLTYGQENAAFSPYLLRLREAIRAVSMEKIKAAGACVPPAPVSP